MKVLSVLQNSSETAQSDFDIPTDDLPGVVPLGLNGAAIAAFGDNPVDLGDAPWPSEVRAAGVKLGESTLNRCFTLGRY